MGRGLLRSDPGSTTNRMENDLWHVSAARAGRRKRLALLLKG